MRWFVLSPSCVSSGAAVLQDEVRDLHISTNRDTVTTANIKKFTQLFQEFANKALLQFSTAGPRNLLGQRGSPVPLLQSYQCAKRQRGIQAPFYPYVSQRVRRDYLLKEVFFLLTVPVPPPFGVGSKMEHH